jgi:hypothetical protein
MNGRTPSADKHYVMKSTSADWMAQDYGYRKKHRISSLLIKIIAMDDFLQLAFG